MERRYIFFYKTTNLINNKFYFGIHTTDNLNDGYLGSGKALKYAINKYGIENFIIERLKWFLSKQEAFDYEEEFVNETYVKDPNCYNMKIGGRGEMPLRSEEIKKKYGDRTRGKTYEEIYGINAEFNKNKRAKSNTGKKRKDETKIKIGLKGLGNKRALGYKHTEEQKENQRKAIAKNGGRNGIKNPRFGKHLSEETKNKIRNTLLNKNK